MYDNIGGKIKGLAKGTFIVEAIAAIIFGIAMMAEGDEGLVIAGALTLFCGPIVAYVGSWILYAFGQLVEDVHAMRDKEGTTEEVKAKRETEERAKREVEESDKHEVKEQTTTTSKPTVSKSNELHELEKKQYANDAMNRRTNSTAPYWCGKCGYDGPYDGNCPNCNSSLKKYNV